MDNSLAFNGINLSLNSSLAMNWFFASDLVANATDYYVVFTKPEGNGQTEPLVVTIGKDDMYPVYKGGKLVQYGMSFDKIAACEMSVMINAVLYVEKDGVLYVSSADRFNYSVLLYCQSMINQHKNGTTEESVKTMRLMIECLNYGAAAQKRFKYKQDEPVNSVVTEAMQEKYGIKDISYTFDGTLDRSTSAGASFYTFYLNLEERIIYTIRFNMGTYAQEELTAVIKNAQGEVVQVISGAEFDMEGKICSVNITVIDAPNMRDNYQIALYSNYVDESNIGNVVSDTLTASVEDYVATAADADREVVVAALRYGDAATMYFG